MIVLVGAEADLLSGARYRTVPVRCPVDLPEHDPCSPVTTHAVIIRYVPVTAPAAVVTLIYMLLCCAPHFVARYCTLCCSWGSVAVVDCVI